MALLALAPAASAQDRAFGSFETGPGERTTFDAVGDPTSATGFFRYEIGTDFFEGTVTCLSVVGNIATVGGIVTNTSPLYVAVDDEGLTFQVVDNGPKGQGDLFGAFAPTELPTPPVCVSPNPANIPVTAGDISVGCTNAKEKKKGLTCRDKGPVALP